jgi:hypothetical protein
VKTPTKGKVIEYLSIQLTINLNLVSLETASFLAVTFDVDFKSTQKKGAEKVVWVDVH